MQTKIRERERERERERGRETDRQTDRQTETDRETETERQRQRQRQRDRDRETEPERKKCIVVGYLNSSRLYEEKSMCRVSFMCATPKELPADSKSKDRGEMCRTMGPGGPCHSEVCLLLLLLCCCCCCCF